MPKIKKLRKFKPTKKAGVISPSGRFYPGHTASTRLQKATRGRIERKKYRATQFSNLISQGAKQYSNQITKQNLRGITISNKRFPNKPFYDINLERTKLVNTTFNGARLTGGNLEGSVIEHCEFKKAELKNMNFSKTNITNTNFNEAILADTFFTDSNINGCIFDKALCLRLEMDNCNLLANSFSQLQVYGAIPMALSANIDMRNSTLTHCKLINNGSYPAFQNNFNFLLLHTKFIECAIDSCMFIGHDGRSQVRPVTYGEFNNCKLHECSFKGIDLTSTIFKKSSEKIKRTDKFGVPTGFSYPETLEIKNCDFTDCDMAGADYSGLLMTKNTFDNANMNHCKLENTQMIWAKFDHTNLQYIKGKKCDFRSGTFTGTDFTNADLTEIIGNHTTYINVIFQEAILEQAILQESTFSDCTFKEANLKKANFHKATFRGVIFENSILEEGRFDECSFTDCTFKGANLKKANFRTAKFHDNIIFEDADLEESDMISCTIDSTTNFRNANLRNVNFQSALLFNVDFSPSQTLLGAKFVDSRLPGANFRDTDLRGVQFDIALLVDNNETMPADGIPRRADFTGANLQGANIGEAMQGDFGAPDGIPDELEEVGAVDTHKVFYSIDINELINLLITSESIPQDTDTGNSLEMYNLIEQRYKQVINRMDGEEDKAIKERYLNVFKAGQCFYSKLHGPPPFNYRSQIANTNPAITFGKAVYNVLQYVDKQPHSFQDNYVQAVIRDSLEGHGAGGESCPRGIVERIVTYIKLPAFLLSEDYSVDITRLEEKVEANTATNEEKEELVQKTAKVKEYKEIINIIDNNPLTLISHYATEWFEVHKEDGPAEFNPSEENIDEIMQSYKDYLKDKFKVVNLRGAKRDKILDIIENTTDYGVVAMKDHILNFVFLFGGRKNRSTKRRSTKRRLTKKSTKRRLTKRRLTKRRLTKKSTKRSTKRK